MKYEVTFEPFAERHFIKTFEKKYQGAWERTRKSLCLEFTFVELLFSKSTAEVIVDSEKVRICKTEFRIAGTQVSRHGSGNRCIIAIHKEENKVCVLLVYHKNDLGGGGETANWKRIVKENYPEYESIIS